MYVVVKEVNKEPYKLDIEDSVRSIQGIIGGCFEPFYCGNGMYALVDEEGLIKELPINFAWYDFPLCGTAVFVGCNGEEFIGLTDEQAEYVCKEVA